MKSADIPYTNLLPSVLIQNVSQLSISTSTISSVPVILSPSQNKEIALKLATEDSAKYHVSFGQLWATITCEDGNYDPARQSAVVRKDGTQEPSYGLAMIDKDYHPDISYASATDAAFSVNFIAQQFAADHADLWTCWRTLFGVK